MQWYCRAHCGSQGPEVIAVFGIARSLCIVEQFCIQTAITYSFVVELVYNKVKDCKWDDVDVFPTKFYIEGLSCRLLGMLVA